MTEKKFSYRIKDTILGNGRIAILLLSTRLVFMSEQNRTSDLNFHFPALDGIRCIAVSLVLFSHWIIYTQLQEFNIIIGAMGVNIFFTLSGFLITRILLIQKANRYKGTRADLLTFYSRRILRIFPLYYGIILLGLLFAIPNAREEIWRLVTFTQNIPESDFGFPESGLYRIFWSVCTEEQFYILFPIFIALIPSKFIRNFLICMILLGLLSRVAVYLTDLSLYHKKWISNNVMLCCMDSLATGAILAWYFLYRRDTLKKLFSYLFFPVSCFLVIVVFTTLSVLNIYDPMVNICMRLTTSYFCFWLIGASICGQLPGFLDMFLKHPWMMYIGRISYGIYMYHLFIPWVVAQFHVQQGDFPLSIPLYAVIYSILTFFIASLSWHFFEKPINNLKSKLQYK